MDDKCKTCGEGAGEMPAVATVHPAGTVVPNTGGGVFARPWTPERAAAVDVRAPKRAAGSNGEAHSSVEFLPATEALSLVQVSTPWFERPASPTPTSLSADSPSLVVPDVEYLPRTAFAPWFQAEGNGGPKVKVGKIPKDEPPKDKKPVATPEGPSKPYEGEPDFPREPVDSDSETDFVAPPRETPAIVVGSDEDRFPDWWDHAPDLPSDGVELKCEQKVRHRLHISWDESGVVGSTPDLDDAKKLSKGKIAAMSAKSIIEDNKKNGLIEKMVRSFQVDVRGWKCETPCVLKITILASKYSVKIGTVIGEVVNKQGQHVAWNVEYRIAHELWAVVDIECVK
ncbi:MAG: hypothetical protein HUU03_03775 [Planctomycetaceae bacterium]|nr:hypothetical protein [Planctomycetota bacterium]NUO15539.1 hypothetical protein [Planctomycetaceae bacterium]